MTSVEMLQHIFVFGVQRLNFSSFFDNLKDWMNVIVWLLRVFNLLKVGLSFVVLMIIEWKILISISNSHIISGKDGVLLLDQTLSTLVSGHHYSIFFCLSLAILEDWIQNITNFRERVSSWHNFREVSSLVCDWAVSVYGSVKIGFHVVWA